MDLASLDSTFGSLDSLATGLVSYAKASNQTWPFVTVPDFAIHAAKMISNCDAIIVGVLALVATEKRAQWERYTITNNQWVNASVQLQADYAFFNGPLEYDTSKYDGVVYGDFGPIEQNVE